MAPTTSAPPQDEAHVVRFEIPPMMRYCAGTCPCTWVTAIALPNLVYFRKLRRNRDKTEEEMKACECSFLTGAGKQEEAQYLDYLVPAQSLMGLSSYFAWYYGYGFYGPAKYPLLLYGLTLASHSVANEGDIPNDPNMILAQRAACAAGTFLCTCCFLRVSKLASLLMLPACGIYIGLTVVTFQGINRSNNAGNNANNCDETPNNANNNQEPSAEKLAVIHDAPPPSQMIPFPQYQRTQRPGRRKKRRRKSILKLNDDHDVQSRNIPPSQQKEFRSSRTNVSFNDTVGIQYHRQLSSSSLSSSSLSSHENEDVDKDIVK